MDKDNNCPGWARRGYCKGKYEQWMKENCMKSCNLCGGGNGGSGKCGYKPSARIVGGEEAPKGAWPCGKHKSEVLQVLHSVEEHWSILSGL